MDFMNTFRLALRALARNKMRSALTMLGIIIGVGAVIAVVSIGQGAQYLVQQGIQAMGTNAVNIVMENIKAGLEKREWNSVRQKMNPELVIRESTRDVAHGSSD